MEYYQERGGFFANIPTVTRNLFYVNVVVFIATLINEPFMISRAVSGIARAFNRFYNNCSILSGDDEELKVARLALCQSVCDCIELGTYLLGISVVDQM